MQAHWLCVLVVLLACSEAVYVDDPANLLIAASSGYDAQIYLAPGNYSMIDNVNIVANIAIYGNSSATLFCSSQLFMFYVYSNLILDGVAIANCTTPVIVSEGSLSINSGLFYQNTMAIAVAQNTSLSVTNSQFTNNSLAAIIADGGTVTALNTSFSGGSYGILAGSSQLNLNMVQFTLFSSYAIMTNSSGNTTIQSGTFTNNQGGIYAVNSLVTCVATNFTNQHLYGISASLLSNIQLRLSIFTANTYSVSTTNATLQTYDCVFSYSSLAISCNYGTCTLEKGKVEDNRNIAGPAGFSAVGSDVTMANVEFSRNSAVTAGSAINIKNSTDVQLANITLHNNTGQYAALYISQSSAIIQNGTFEQNTANRGGAVELDNCTAVFYRSHFKSNTANQGPAIYGHTSEIYLEDCSFTENIGTAVGGAFSSMFSKVTIENTEFTHNSGGALFSSNDNVLHITNSSFKHNQDNAYAYAAGLGVLSGAQVVLYNITFAFNNATTSAGAMYALESSVTSYLTAIYNNSAPNGAGLKMEQGALNAHAAFFIGNVATNGSAVSVDGTTAWFDVCFFILNSAKQYGGGMQLSHGAAIIQSSEFIFNDALDGAAIYADTSSQLTLENVTCQQNSAQAHGGCVYALRAFKISITSSSFAQNTANGNGGALYIDETDVTINTSTIWQNYAAGQGGGAYTNAGDLFIINCTISDNYAQNGGGIFTNYAYTEIDQTLISSNYAENEGGGLYVGKQVSDQNLPTVFAFGSKFIENKAPENANLFVYSEEIFSTYMVETYFISENRNISLPANFCCALESKAVPYNETCNFPACNSATCTQSTTCNCPLDYIHSIPILPTVNSTKCNCAPGFYGSICNGDVCTFAECSEHATCSKELVTEPICACYSGYQGDGFNCSDVDECLLNTTICGTGKCSNTNGSFFCLPCSAGYTQSGSQCEDVNECAMNLCDVHVTCINLIGNYSCGKCPLGYTGSGFTKCIPLCGDGNCDISVGENCVSCSLDCKLEFCDVCGDGACQSPETCSSCSEDCCTPQQCHDCVHGTCKNGLCGCTDGWSGPTCEDKNQPTVIVPNNTQPIVDILPDQNSIAFSISLRSLVEVDPQGNFVSKIDMTDYTFTFLESKVPGSDVNMQYNYSVVLANQANVIITFIQFKEDGSYTFNDETSFYPANTLKLTLKISNWPFKSLNNFLNVEMDNLANSSETYECVESEKNSEESLLWVRLSINGVSVYAQFLPNANIDTRNRLINFILQQDNSVAARLPHFWGFAELDPIYSILLDSPSDDRSCNPKSKSSKHSRTVTIAVTASVIGTAIVIAAVWASYKTFKRRKERSKLIKMTSYQN